MARISVLPKQLVDKIAAGEVIERPASVVKELVENAIDAGADSIEVDIEAGGKSLIRVADTGCGMDAEDLLLAFSSHATSKLASVDDLFAIRTMGFRGEALASIAAVAQVTALSRRREDDFASRVTGDGSPPETAEQTAGAPGTVVEVRNLFFNVPARRKFLRSDSAELARITDVMTQFALSYPETAFQLTHNKRLVMRTATGVGLQELCGRRGQALRMRHDLAGQQFHQYGVVGVQGKEDGIRLSRRGRNGVAVGQLLDHRRRLLGIVAARLAEERFPLPKRRHGSRMPGCENGFV